MNRVYKIVLKMVLLAVPAVAWVSCKDDETEELNLSRRFRPALIEIDARETSAILGWSPSLFTMPGEVEYLVEVSKDGVNFTNVEFTQTTTDPGVIVLDTDIDIRTDYFARVKALGKDGMDDSSWLVSEAFQITGEVFILPVQEHHILTDGALITWDPRDVVTKLVLTPDGGAPQEIAISGSEAAAGEKTISGLSPNTTYTVEIFKGTVGKGSVTFKTKDAFTGANIVDLTGITGKPTILADTLSDIPSGSVVLLKRGETYTIATKDFDRSVTITSAPDFNPEFATILSSNSFNIVASSNIDSLVFRDINITGVDYAGDYLVNINRVGNIGTVRFENVRGHRLRGLFRMQTGSTGTKVTSLFINNAVIDSVRDFSIVNTNNQNTVANIRITNTTIYNARKVIDHRSPGSNSIVFENCTFHNLPSGGPAGGGSVYFIDMDSQNSANPITITNCIFGASWDDSGAGNDARGIRVGTSTSTVVTNSYKTSDFVSTNPTYQIPGLLDYPGASTSLFQDPANGDFSIKDASFAGANSAGDPRWR